MIVTVPSRASLGVEPAPFGVTQTGIFPLNDLDNEAVEAQICVYIIRH